MRASGLHCSLSYFAQYVPTVFKPNTKTAIAAMIAISVIPVNALPNIRVMCILSDGKIKLALHSLRRLRDIAITATNDVTPTVGLHQRPVLTYSKVTPVPPAMTIWT